MTVDTQTLDVLLVEDNPGDAKLVKHHLRQQSPQTLAEEIDITHVDTFEATMETLESKSYDLILLDLGLPDTDGIETLEQVDFVVQTTPVVVLTGLDDTETALTAIQHGAQDYLPKDDIDTGTLWRSLRYAVERHRNEQELRRRTEQLEFFSGILRHDVNNGIEVISRNAELLESELPDDQQERAETIIDWSENIADLTRKVQRMIQGITRGEQHELEAVDLSTVIESQVETVGRMDDDVTVETSVPFGVSVQADRMLEEVLHNLLTNAIEHNDAEEPHVAVEVTTRGETVQIDIADNGPGLPEREHERLLSRGSPTRQLGGGEFGLYFVRTMVESYGGSIEARENDPRGTVVTVELPAA